MGKRNMVFVIPVVFLLAVFLSTNLFQHQLIPIYNLSNPQIRNLEIKTYPRTSDSGSEIRLEVRSNPRKQETPDAFHSEQRPD